MALLILGWSSGFVGIRYASNEASVALLLFWRTFLSGLILLPFALFYGPRMRLRDALAGLPPLHSLSQGRLARRVHAKGAGSPVSQLFMCIRRL